MLKLLAVIGMLCVASAAQAQQQKKPAQQKGDTAKVKQCVEACVQRAALLVARPSAMKDVQPDHFSVDVSG